MKPGDRIQHAHAIAKYPQRMRESGDIIAISMDRHYETLNSYSGI